MYINIIRISAAGRLCIHKIEGHRVLWYRVVGNQLLGVSCMLFKEKMFRFFPGIFFPSNETFKFSKIVINK